jgi:hypothetical protein
MLRRIVNRNCDGLGRSAHRDLAGAAMERRTWRSDASEDSPHGYVGALTDITRQKEIEVLHLREVERRAADAEENRVMSVKAPT